MVKQAHTSQAAASTPITIQKARSSLLTALFIPSPQGVGVGVAVLVAVAVGVGVLVGVGVNVGEGTIYTGIGCLRGFTTITFSAGAAGSTRQIAAIASASPAILKLSKFFIC